MRALGIVLFAPLGYLLLTGYLFAKVRPAPIATLDVFAFEGEREFERVAA